MLKVRSRRCLIVGGGSVALRRAKGLLACGAIVTVVAPRVMEEIMALQQGEVGGGCSDDESLDQSASFNAAGTLTVHQRRFDTSDLAGQWLVVIATDDEKVNQAVHELAQKRGVLVNRADDPGQGDVQIPAHEQVGPITISVHTDGISAAAAAAIRDQLMQTLDPAWVVLLEVVRPYRQAIQSKFTVSAVRQAKLRLLTGEQAMMTLQEQGIPALRKYCDDLLAAEETCS